MYWLRLVLLLGLVVNCTAEERLTGNSRLNVGPPDVSNGQRVQRANVSLTTGICGRTVLEINSSPEESLRHLVESLLERIEHQDNRLQLLEMMVSNNEEDLKRKEIRIDQLERELKSVSKQSKLPEHVSDSNRPLEFPKTDKTATTSNTIPIKKCTDEQPPRAVRVAPYGAGTFSVSLSERDLHLQPNLVIAFDEVLLDMDGHYHAGDGVYTVPVSGVYVFTWRTTGTTTDNVETELVINGSSRGTIFSDAETGHTWDSTTGVILTSVSAGDHVFIRSKSSEILHSSNALGKAMFSGWRLN